VRNGDDLACYGVGLWVLDDISDMPGFGDAMESVGWVVENDQGLIFPRFFDEYNVEPDGKNKSKNAERQARYREKKRLGVESKSNVTSNVTRNVTVTPREEERRGEKSSHYVSLSLLGIKHFEFLSENTVCPEWLAPSFCRWLAYRFSRDSVRVDENVQEVWISKLVARGQAKALADIEFSIEKQAKNILNAENDFDKIAKAKLESAKNPQGRETRGDKARQLIEDIKNGRV
jgi:hypothetical protein